MKNINYDRIPHLYRVIRDEYNDVWEVFAKDAEEAIRCLPEQERAGNLQVEEILTPEGWRVMQLRDIPKGSYFVRVRGYAANECMKRVWVKGEYDRSEKQYYVYQAEDVNRDILLKGTSLVTIDVTY